LERRFLSSSNFTCYRNSINYPRNLGKGEFCPKRTECVRKFTIPVCSKRLCKWRSPPLPPGPLPSIGLTDSRRTGITQNDITITDIMYSLYTLHSCRTLSYKNCSGFGPMGAKERQPFSFGQFISLLSLE